MTPLPLTIWRAGTRAVGWWAPRAWVSPPPSVTGPADVLVHGASAGEVRAAKAVQEAARRLGGGEGWRITTGTAAGMAMGADGRLCRDVPGLVAELLDATRPRALLLVESELWPNLLAAARSRDIPVGVIGATVSPRTARRLATSPATARALLRGVAGFAAASDDDAARLLALGADPRSVAVTGWIKWPGAPPRRPGPTDPIPAVPSSGPLLVLGSVHPGELARASAWLEGTALAPGPAFWVVVPRHPSAVRSLEGEARAHLPAGSFLVDPRFGVLREWYRRADAALVGGGGTGRGHHSLLEPLAAGLAPLYFAAGADPGGVAETLRAAGCALALRPEGPSGDPIAAPALRWEEVTERWDGRATGLEFLRSRGVSLIA